MNELPKLPGFMATSAPAALVANDRTEPQPTRRPKADREPPNRIQSIRLAAAMEKLHDTAHDSTIGEDAGRTAASALAMTMLQNFPTIIWALRQAGKPAKR
jgi:hypothetical protein